jgi:hypothetical protein
MFWAAKKLTENRSAFSAFPPSMPVQDGRN